MSKELLPHQQRVVDEQSELEVKIYKLSGFVKTKQYDLLPAREQTLLKTQLDLMNAYSNILGLRIGEF